MEEYMSLLNNKKNVLLINMGWEQQEYIEKLHKLECNIFAVHHEKCNEDSRIQDLLICDYFSVNEIIQFAVKNDIEAVLTDQCDYALYAAAAVNDALSLTGVSMKEAIATTDKGIQRNLLSLNNAALLQPRWFLCKDFQNAHDNIEEVGLPAIVKPVDARGSFGVTRIDTVAELKSAFFSAITHSLSRQVIIEQFISGEQYTVDGYIDLKLGAQVLNIAKKKMLSESLQVAVEISYNQLIPDNLYSKLEEYNLAVVKALGIKFGMTHGEYMITPSGDIYLIEIANRGGGCFTSTLILHAATGFDFSSKLIADSFAVESPRCNYDLLSRNSISLIFFSIPQSGKIESIEGVEKLLSNPNILYYRCNISIGDDVVVTSNDADRHGFIIVKDVLIININYELQSIDINFDNGEVVNPKCY
ncbi:ATP-grasp domain-containing protein [Pseudoalteromonas sp. SA25]|uniref:ATP-grasp domain-containing protein n=1 Tax=Pseudoalteromonas sp. SA25 TaxID=2686347 RepID=UPI0013FE4953|nr:ATP-grasp domain-containing protein [Pseudoalteromonas sp. SA25]